MKRTKLDALKTREAVVEAALELFALQGYDGTTLDEIARKAGLTRGAVYWYFRNKDELLSSMLDSFEHLLADKAAETFSPARVEGMTLRDLAAYWIRVWVLFIHDHRSMFRTRLLHTALHPSSRSPVRRSLNAILMDTVWKRFKVMAESEGLGSRISELRDLFDTFDAALAYRLILDEPAPEISPELIISRSIRSFQLGLDALSDLLGPGDAK